MKTLLSIIVILIISTIPILASTEGKMFLRVDENKNVFTTDLEKVFERDIQSKNLYKANLHLYDQNEGRKAFDIIEDLKKNIDEDDRELSVEIEGDFCIKNCPPNKYPNIEIHYSFNKPPKIELNDVLFENEKAIFSWEGSDRDGKFLEYFLEVNSEEKTYKSHWITETSKGKILEPGKYTWRVTVRDNSKVNNVVKSEQKSFEIEKAPLKKPKILKPKDELLTNEKEIDFIIGGNKGVKNVLYINNEEIYSTTKKDIRESIKLKTEGINNIKVVSYRGKEEVKDQITIFTDWTPPSKPNFDLKEKDNSLLIKIYNERYEKAHIFLNNEKLKTIEKTTEYINLIKEIDDEEQYEIGVILFDKVGNESEKKTKMFLPFKDKLGYGSGTEGVANITPPGYSTCILKYNFTYEEFEYKKCNLTKPQLVATLHKTEDKEIYKIKSLGVYNPHLKLIIHVYACTSNIQCSEQYITSYKKNTIPYNLGRMYVDRKFEAANRYVTTSDLSFESTIVNRENLAGKELTTRYYLNLGLTFNNTWIDIAVHSPHSNVLEIPEPLIIKEDKSEDLFRFPFSRYIGVTQWHGYTDFQSPHTGIDFGSYKEPIYAPGDGYIQAVGWDNYYGECLSGGNFVRIEHDNGIHTVYFHLKDYKKENGKEWQVGERIQRGEKLGTSGNTGAFNCQPLGYHLHFETRQNRYQSSHMNPVPHVDVNWDKIPTIDHERYPGRLTGDNPHPGW